MSPDGVLLIDKPPGLSSAALVGRIRRHFGIKKAGHAGTLDPFATGLMVICLGRATRISRYFLGGDKTYEATLRLGSATDTLDPEGKITDTGPIPPCEAPEVIRILETFTGPQMQAPPVYSALKHEGVPLYRLARMGKPVQKPPRPVTIHSLRLLDIRPPDIRFSVHCSAGTYIRTLAADMAQALGTVGHLAALRRTASCGFHVKNALPPDSIQAARTPAEKEALLIPMNTAIAFLPEIRANNTLTEKIFHGKVLCTMDLPGLSPDEGGPVRIVAPEGEIMAVIRRNGENPDLFSYDAVFARPADGTILSSGFFPQEDDSFF